jgi:hypothetical protein
VVIGIVAFAQSVSLVVLMAKKHHYDIDANKVKYENLRKNKFGDLYSAYPALPGGSRR